MSSNKLTQRSDSELVDLFEGLAMRKGDADVMGHVGEANKLTKRMMQIDAILRERGMPARLGLLSLLDHANPAVRYEAARRLLALAPDRARAVIAEVHALGLFAISGAAGMNLDNLDSGRFIPS